MASLFDELDRAKINATYKSVELLVKMVAIQQDILTKLSTGRKRMNYFTIRRLRIKLAEKDRYIRELETALRVQREDDKE